MWDTIQTFAHTKLAVIGDVMLDIYVHGTVERVSPEAPVPIVRRRSERVVPGGAANVAANMAALGAEVDLVGVARHDDTFSRLSENLKTVGRVNLGYMVFDEARCTTTKTRVLGDRQQIIRLDVEDTSQITAVTEEAVIAAALAAIDGSDLVVCSDYGKGTLTKRVLQTLIAHARAAGKTILVDPKNHDLSVYRGASILTPNRAELARATGMPCETNEEAETAARVAQAQSQSDILLTRSEKGMTYFRSHGPPLYAAAVAREVFDVSGAGDTVIAVLGVALASGHSIIKTMRLANHAAGIVIGKLGTATISVDELASSLQGSEEHHDVRDGRLLRLDELLATRSYWRQCGLTVGLANGCFDLVHPGHISLIRQASNSCDRLVIALNTDASVRRLKGPPRPFQTEDARAEVIGGLKGVSAVVLFDEDTPTDLIASLKPDILVKGADYTEDKVVGADLVRELGGSILLATLTPGQSTTSLAAHFTKLIAE